MYERRQLAKAPSVILSRKLKMNGNYSCFWAAVVARTISQKHFFMKASFSKSKWEFSQVLLLRNLTDFYHFFGEFFTYSGNSWLLMIKRSVKKIGRKSNSMEVYPPISKTASMHIVWKLLNMSHLNLWTCLVTLFDCKLQVFKNSPKWTIFGIFN